ncbi:gliding motility-associated-like protein [Mucilaginibacter yixingensis]|uniref:Gliding motility-associated-like protein n=1 Tax=Mucilaginibacter yixingensis TaxID=1295612 RepID=A0A2T5J7P5_9SPHI|nr:gliding motility-associated C-terminal domain-containing protein [Mucilaginibacter yixingensis]PTQ95170.1 gliding motility-associated-like protein [Mucilaginibacter yixingensis]
MTIYKRVGIFIVLLLGAIAPVFGQDCTLKVSIDASNNGIICSGNAVVLTATATDGTGPYSYVWSTGDITNTASVNKGGTYTVTVTDKTQGCQPVVQNINVIETPAPPAPTATGAIVCRGTPATLTATAPGGTYNWYTVPVGGTPVFSGNVFQTPPIQDQTFYYVETIVGTCVSSRTLVIVSLSSNPTTQGSTTCAGTTGTVSATGGDSYTWYDAPNGNQVGTGSTFVSPPLTSTTTYYVVATTNGCSSAPTPATIVVTPYPQAPTAASFAICTGSTANLHASGNGLLDWFDVPSGGTSLISSPDYTTPALTETKKYWVQSTLNGCSSLRTEVTITVNPIPDAPVTQPATVCSGTGTTLTASSTSSTTFNWYADAAGTQLLATGNTYNTPALTSPATYYVQTLNGSCVSTLTPLQVSVTPVPPAPAVSTPVPVCANTSAVLTATAPGGNYEWFDVPAGGNSLFSGATYTTPALAANTTFYVQTTVNGCVSPRTAVPVTVLTSVQPPTTNNVSICPGTTATLTASSADNYQWYDAPTGGTLLSTNASWTTPALTTTTTYYVQTTTGNCSSARKPATVTVNAAPAAPVVSAVTAICPGSKAQITASVADGGIVTWYDAPTGGGQLAVGNVFTTPALYQSTTYYAQNRVGECLSSRVAVNVPVVQIDYPQFEYPSSTYCKTGSNPTPTISDPTGGTFTASPAGLKFINATTGEIDIANSLPKSYTITFIGNESCHAQTQSPLSIVITPNATFSYAGPFCQYGANPKPNFPTGATEGSFSATPAGLVFIDPATGVIDLQRSAPGTYTVTNTIAANGTCPQASKTTSVTIGAGVLVNAGPDQIVNAGVPVQLSGSVIGGVTTGSWTGGNGTFSPDRNTLNAVYTPAPNEASVTLRLTSGQPSGNCGAKSDDVVITIIPKPSAPTVQNPTVCSGSSVTLMATAPGGAYKWYDAPTGGTLLASGPQFITPVVTESVTYYVSTTVSGNISDRAPVTVNVSPIPAAPVAQPGQTCINTTTQLIADGSTGNYEWYDVATGGTPLFSGKTFTTPVITANISFYVQAINANGCPGPRTQVDVSIVPAPVITSAAAGTACSGIAQNYSITSDTPGATYSWERPAVPGISNAAVAMHAENSISETLINTGTSPINVTYNIIATAGSCNTTFTYVVTVNPLGSPTSPQKVAICNGSPLNYTVSFSNSETKFNWSRAEVTGISNAAVTGQEATNIQEILHNNTDAPIDVPYVFNYTEGNCTNTFTLLATVNPTVIITSDTETRLSACSTDPFSYQIQSNVPSATFSWTRDISSPNITVKQAGDPSSSQINEILENTTGGGEVVYHITVSANGCPGEQKDLHVTVNPKPATPDARATSPVCVGQDIVLNAPASSGPIPTYIWQGPNGYTNISNQPEVRISNATPAMSGTYKLYVIVNNNSCASVPGQAEVKVVSPPTTFNAGDDQTVCPLPNPVNLLGTTSSDNKVVIWTTSGKGAFTSNSSLNTQYIPSQEDIENGSVKLTMSSTGFCTPVSDDVIITFAPTPAVDAGPDQDVCSKNVVNILAGKSIKGGLVNWTTSGSGTFTPAANVANAYYMPSKEDIAKGSVTLTLHYSNFSKCDIEHDDMVMRFIPPPTVYAGGVRYVLKGRQITLEPTVSDPNVSYMWSPNINMDNPTRKNPVITGDIDRTYTLVVIDSRNCVSDPSQTLIKVGPIITIANTFTPNGDGTNDTWNITGLIAYPEASVDVFNRNGTPVFHSLGYPIAWDGTFNGQPLPAGTYYYVVHLNYNKNQVLSGAITIIR